MIISSSSFNLKKLSRNLICLSCFLKFYQIIFFNFSNLFTGHIQLSIKKMKQNLQSVRF